MTLHHCWACHYDPAKHTGSGQRGRAADIYEHCVETIESFGRQPFTLSEAWSRTGWGPSSYTYMRHAVLDLYHHGILTCWRRDRARRCVRWGLADGVAAARDGIAKVSRLPTERLGPPRRY